MSYDPIINYYDKPGGPSVPGRSSGGGGVEQYGTGIEMVIKANIDTTLPFAVLTTADVTDEDSYTAALIGSFSCRIDQIGTSSFVRAGAHIAVGNNIVQATMTLDDTEFTDFEVKTISDYSRVLFTVPETNNPDSLLVLNIVVD